MENYQIELDNIIKRLGRKKPSLVLHACCAPCSSYVLEYLSDCFDITVLFYNPNIYPKSEFDYRAGELIRLLREMPLKCKVSVVVDSYDENEFFEAAKGLEEIPEGGERCFKCYRLRLQRAADYAAENGFDYFSTTLSVSPYKNAGKLNSIGMEISEKAGVKWLPGDFKKKNGYKRSIELSKEYDLYRQDYCGCVFSKKQRDKKMRYE